MSSDIENDVSINTMNCSAKDDLIQVIKKSELIQEKKNPEEKEENLIFDKKNISIFKLYCHISGSLEIFLSVIAIIMTIGAGLSNIFVDWVRGDSTNSFTLGSQMDDIKKIVGDELFNIIFQYVTEKLMEPNINKQVKLFLIIGAIMFVCNFLMIYLWPYLALKQLNWLKNDYFRIILRQEQGWFDENNVYEFATKVQAQLEMIELGLGDRLGQFLMMTTELIGGFIAAFIASWKLTLILLTCFPFIIAGALIMIFPLKKAIVSSRKTYEIAGGIAEELLYNIKTVASFVNFDYEINRFDALIDQVEKYDDKKNFISGISIGIMIFGLFLGFTVTLLFARKLILDDMKEINNKNIINEYMELDNENGSISLGTVHKVLYNVINSIFALGQVAPNIQVITAACSASSDYFTLYERVPKIYESEKNLTPDRDSIKGNIQFKNIKFIYPSDKTKKPILNGLNLEIEAGKKVALVGESGCGKTTIVNLLERLYEPVEGQILIDGIDIKEFNIEYLRNLMGYVQQEPVLFNKSIKENLIIGREKVIKDLGDIDELMEKACEEAYIKDFILLNPDKYDYVVGIKGNKLSGGQKQRIAIARAILAKPKILILDEATSALDNKAEKEVQKALDNISKSNVTTLIIAHKLSTIKNADIIYALKNGQIVEKGTHQELLEKNGYYADLVKSQMGTEDNHKEIERLKGIKKASIETLSAKYSNLMKNEVLNKEDIIISQQDIKIKFTEILELLSDRKLDIFLGTIGGLISGGGTPLSGLFFGKALVALSPQDIDVIKKDGLKWSLLHLVIAALGGVSFFFKSWKLVNLGNVITAKMRKNVFRKYLELDSQFYDEDYNSPGSLLTKLSSDTIKISAIVLSVFGPAISTIGGIVFAIILGMIYDWRLTLISAAFLPFILFFTVFKAYFRANGTQSDHNLKMEAGSIISQCVISTKTVFSFNCQQKALDMYKSIIEKEKTKILKKGTVSGLFYGIGVFLDYINKAVLIKCSFEFFKNQTLKYNDMISALYCLFPLNGIVKSLMLFAELPKAKEAFKSLLRILRTPSSIIAFEEVNKDKLFPSEFKGKIEFRNVTFAYPTKPENIILKNLSLTINPGQHIALVGFSGSGKSTIIQLIERYYDPIKGDIFIDDINVKDYNLFKLRKKIGLVSQEPVLFKRSIYENILYGRLDAEEIEVYQAAEKAAITKFFKDGQKGEKDETVSGGEKQRLAIARVFLKNPSILLLDEATSALDKESEIEVQKSLNELQKGRTSVTVAHRLSTIINSDIIYYLEYGKVIEKGTHNELISKKGKYYKLYEFTEK